MPFVSGANFFILGIGMSHETLKAAGILFAGKGLWLAGGRAGPTVSYRTTRPTVVPNIKNPPKIEFNKFVKLKFILMPAAI